MMWFLVSLFIIAFILQYPLSKTILTASNSIKLPFVVYSLYTNCNLNRHWVLRRCNRCFLEVLIFLVWSSSSSHVTESSRCYCNRDIFLATRILSLISEYFHSLNTCQYISTFNLKYSNPLYILLFICLFNQQKSLYPTLRSNLAFMSFALCLGFETSTFTLCCIFLCFLQLFSVFSLSYFFLANLFPCLLSISYSSYSFHLQDIASPSFKMTPTPVCFSDLLLWGFAIIPPGLRNTQNIHFPPSHPVTNCNVYQHLSWHSFNFKVSTLSH